MGYFKNRQKKRIYAIPENHDVLVFKLVSPPLTNLVHFDMVDINGKSLKQIQRINDWKSFFINLRYSSPNYSLQVINSSDTKNFLKLRDEYFKQ